MRLISVIIATYNWPQALTACLHSFELQTDRDFEIIIADDGSNEATQASIQQFIAQSPLSIRHACHEDLGFRAGTIRNKAAAISRGEYLLFVDGDCLVFPHFIARHRQFAESGYFVPGNRLLLSQKYTETVLQEGIALAQKSSLFWGWHWLKRDINRLFPLLYNPMTAWRYLKPLAWEKAMTCNLGMWKADFIAVNGFDELFEGWGYEDSDLVIRLIHHGIRRKEGRFGVPVIHLWHPHNDRSRHDENYQRLMQRLEQHDLVWAVRGVEQYLDNA
jgi:glycosyltransferase involved in cell wall biosynthesis